MTKKIAALIIFSSLLVILPLTDSADAFKNRGSQIVANLQPGESFTGEWQLLSEQPDTTDILINVEGKGSELVSVPDKIVAEPNTWYTLEITISVPEDYQNDVYLEPRVYALIPGEQKEGTVNINLRMMHPLAITIGNPPLGQTLIEDEPEETVEEPEAMEKVQEEKSQQEATPFELNAPAEEEGGGCLIATATYGSELASQVQMLREIRDNKLITTESGSSFMTGFNSLYYSFSPTIADWERQNPVFKETVKITLTPLITSLSILNYIDMDSEAAVLGYGISLIILNIGIYLIAPAIVIIRLRR